MNNDKYRAALGGLVKLWLPVVVLSGLWTPSVELVAALQLALIATIDAIFLAFPSTPTEPVP